MGKYVSSLLIWHFLKSGISILKKIGQNLITKRSLKKIIKSLNLVVHLFYRYLNILQVFKTFYIRIWAIKKFGCLAFHFKCRLINIEDENNFSTSIYTLDYVIDTIWKEIKSEDIKKYSSSFKSWVSSFAPKYYPIVQKFHHLLLRLLANEKILYFLQTSSV